MSSQGKELFGITVMSDSMTDIGLPVDSLLALARIDASFSNVYSSSLEWGKKTAPPALGAWAKYRSAVPNAFWTQKGKAERAVTPQVVVEALATDAFTRQSRVQQGSIQDALNLTKSIRSEGDTTEALGDFARLPEDHEQNAEVVLGMFTAMLVIALHEVPADVTEFTVDLRQTGSPMLISRRADGWWQASRKGKIQSDVFKLDGGTYSAIEGGVEKRADISTMLGLDKSMKLAELVSVKHPLGVIKIAREKASMEFRLEEQENGEATGTTLLAGEVRWAARVK